MSQGGGLALKSGAILITDTLFSVNKLASGDEGSALYAFSETSFYGFLFRLSYVLDNVTFLGHTGTVIRNTGIVLQFVCPLGYYMPWSGDYDGGDFVGCAYLCPASFYGDASNHTTPLCAGLCPPGHYCEEQTVEPTPCFIGSYNPAFGGASSASCTNCSAGYFADGSGRTSCAACEAGKSISTIGSSGCELCEPGKAVGVAGSPACYDCAAGSFAATAGLGVCETCAAGTYSATAGTSACTSCPAGGFCADAGAASALVFQECTGGSFNPSTGSSSSDDCRLCTAGTANPLPGSTEASACASCLPGSYTATDGVPSCSLCDAGSYQVRQARARHACMRCNQLGRGT